MAEAADFPGMTPSPARRWLRRTGALLAGAPLLAGLLQLPASPAHAAGRVSLKDASDTGTVVTGGSSVGGTASGSDSATAGW